MSYTDGVALIAVERERQIADEGYTAEHDDEHLDGELSGAAAAYATHARNQIASGLPLLTATPPSNLWRWSADAWKPDRDPVRNLMKAGALIAAEIDRLTREAEDD